MILKELDSMNDIYKTPESPLEKQNDKVSKKYTIVKKFLISLAWVFPLFLILIAVVLPKERFLIGGLGALMFSAAGSFVSSFIPTQQKYIFVGISIFLTFGVAMLIGLLLPQS